jgi:hypothetical protein
MKCRLAEIPWILLELDQNIPPMPIGLAFVRGDPAICAERHKVKLTASTNIPHTFLSNVDAQTS